MLFSFTEILYYSTIPMDIQNLLLCFAAVAINRFPFRLICDQHARADTVSGPQEISLWPGADPEVEIRPGFPEFYVN